MGSRITILAILGKFAVSVGHLDIYEILPLSRQKGIFLYNVD